ncbi:MAG: hypothetical protein AUJ75_01920 [Candidatus Omnitrophica bacterium CG1_02_49_10]|nr:MAG: hypothetical protein AUJ75_01920 [Candidatus Omnitrophica bacterium CG1_02_49_10]
MKKITKIFRFILKEYGRGRGKPRADAVGELIKTVLSQNTSDINSERAYAALKRRYGSWNLLLRSTPAVIADTIRSGGLADMKALRIKEILKEIVKREGRLSLSRLKGMSDGDALKYLISLKGVGVKTASVVLLFSFKRPLMPVDTHVFRVARRIGLIPKDTSVLEAHAILTEVTPDKLITDIHLDLIEHGREICKAQRPLCDKCIVRGCCDHYKSRRYRA